MTFEEAAAVPDGVIIALSYLRRVDLRRRRKILIYGASGSIGTAGVQLAKLLRCRRHRGMHHEERRAREIARSRPGQRPHAGRVHDEQRDVRLYLRRGRQALAQAVQSDGHQEATSPVPTREGRGGRPTTGSASEKRDSSPADGAPGSKKAPRGLIDGDRPGGGVGSLQPSTTPGDSPALSRPIPRSATAIRSGAVQSSTDQRFWGEPQRLS
jgi:hypothetical protein